MTIREHFQRIYQRITYGTVAVAIVVIVLLDWRYPNLSPLQNFLGALLLGLVIAVVLMLVYRRRFLCPRCGTDLGKLRRQEFLRERRSRGWFRVKPQLLWDAWSACPHCGVSFDDPYR